MKSISVSAGTGRLKVHLELFVPGDVLQRNLAEGVLPHGEGICGYLHGGTFSHVGGVVLASPGIVLHGKRLSACDIWSNTVPGHKDAVAAEVAARKLCVATGEPVSITCGIHVDDADPDELKQLVAYCGAAVDFALAKLGADDE